MHARTLPLCALTLALGACSTPEIRVQATYGELEPDGDVALTDTSGGGGFNASNSLDELGIEDEEETLGGRVDFKWGAPHLSIATNSASWDGSGTLSSEFGGIPASANVDTELDLGLHRAVLTFDVVPTDLIELGLGFGVSLIDFEATVTETEPLIPGDESESIDEMLPVPMVAARLGARLWRIDVEALVAGLHYDVDGDKATYIEADLNGRLALFGAHGGINGSLVAGWRAIDLEAEFEDDSEEVEADLSFRGPYLGLQIGF
jgi:hypothetical protein